MPLEIDRNRIEQIVRKVLSEDNPVVSTQSCPTCINNNGNGDGGIFSSIDQAVQAAKNAYPLWRALPLEKRAEIIESIREVARIKAKELAEMAHSETGFGRVDSKIQKNLLVAEKTPGIELLESKVYTGDHGLTLVERAPYGVIASITPSTNPTSTIINNTISMISGGNTAVFNVHPRAKKVSVHTVKMINKTIQEMGGPANVITALDEPTIESAQALMKHVDVNLLVVTGGAEVVKAAMLSGKKAVCAGPGNPPVVVDENVDIDKAALDIINSCSFDNNLVCSDEKEVFVVASVADRLKAAMRSQGAYEIQPQDIERMTNCVFKEQGPPNKPGKINLKLVGQDASAILNEAGFSSPTSTRMVLMEVPSEHNLVYTEQMMPVMPLVRVANVEQAIQMALKAEHGFRHTAVMHSFHLPSLSQMAKAMDTTIFVKNASSYSGLGYKAEGYTSFTIGTRSGEGLTTCLTFTRERRCALVDYFRIV